MRRRAADAEDERLVKLLRGRLLQGHAAAVCVCSGEALHGGVCACALDAPPSVAARDPWELAGAAAELRALADEQTQRLSRKSAALRAAERDAHAHGWRCIFVKEDATAAAARARHAPPAMQRPTCSALHHLCRARGTPSGRWRRRGAGELVGAPACAGIACAAYEFEPRDQGDASLESGRWELREFREATRRDGARDAQGCDEQPVHLLLCCVRRCDDGAMHRGFS